MPAVKNAPSVTRMSVPGKQRPEGGFLKTFSKFYRAQEGDYPQVAEEVATRVVAGEFDRGLLICGTGQGMVKIHENRI